MRGIFIATFIFITAFTGFLYISSLQIEQYIYKEQFFVKSENSLARKLGLQIKSNPNGNTEFCQNY